MTKAIEKIDSKYLKKMSDFVLLKDDEWAVHEELDAFLVEALKEVGCLKVVELYESMQEKFWYE